MQASGGRAPSELQEQWLREKTGQQSVCVCVCFGGEEVEVETGWIMSGSESQGRGEKKTEATEMRGNHGGGSKRREGSRYEESKGKDRSSSYQHDDKGMGETNKSDAGKRMAAESEKEGREREVDRGGSQQCEVVKG